MENILLKYMIERFNKESEKTENELLPFITIARLHGCNGNLVAQNLVEKLNNRTHGKKNLQPWHWISKEILESSARQLNINQDQVLRIFKDKWHGTIEEMLTSFTTKSYKYDNLILKTITKVIKDFASRGNVVILGRAGYEATSKMKNGFHVALTAPFEWRAQVVKANEKFASLEDAGRHIKLIDTEREALRKKLCDNHSGATEYFITYNCKYFCPEVIADSIINLLKSSGFIA